MPTEKISRPRSWPDYALFMVAVAFCAFSAKAFVRKSAPSAPAVIQTKVSRGLASISHEQAVEERSTRTVDFNCQEEKNVRIQTSANLLRLTAAGCGGRILRATNQSTGETLLLFERTNGISTHYFPLKTGTNRILIEWKGAKKSAKIIEVEKS